MQLLQPDSYDGDWYGWVTNQSGHFLLGMVIALITRRVWPAVMVAIAFEFMQWSPDVIDSITDVAFTVAGALFYLTANNVVLWASVGAFLIGIWQRRK